MEPINILCLNGSLRGRQGNTARAVEHIRRHVAGQARVVELCLATLDMPLATLEQHLQAAQALLVCSGVYWNSHGSPMQRFLEVATAWETTDLFFGKPAGIVLTMDSVGGMEVAARLAGVLNLFGCTTPPLGTVVLSRVAQMAWEQAPQTDVYSQSDLGLLADNLVTAARPDAPLFGRWAVQPTLAAKGGFEAIGVLDIDREPWLKI